MLLPINREDFEKNSEDGVYTVRVSKVYNGELKNVKDADKKRMVTIFEGTTAVHSRLMDNKVGEILDDAEDTISEFIYGDFQ